MTRQASTLLLLALLACLPRQARADDAFEDPFLDEHPPVEIRPSAIDLIVTSYVSDRDWGPGHGLALELGYRILALEPLMLRISAGYGHEIPAAHGGDTGGHALVMDGLVSIVLPRILSGRILLTAGALTQFRRTWASGNRDVFLFSVGPAFHARFHLRHRTAFFLEVDGCPVFLFGSLDRAWGFEIAIRGGFSFGV